MLSRDNLSGNTPTVALWREQLLLTIFYTELIKMGKNISTLMDSSWKLKTWKDVFFPFCIKVIVKKEKWGHKYIDILMAIIYFDDLPFSQIKSY